MQAGEAGEAGGVGDAGEGGCNACKAGVRRVQVAVSAVIVVGEEERRFGWWLPSFLALLMPPST
jgi:hypothetical protein